MATGKVKYFNEVKGFGMIIDAATGQEIPVHVSAIKTEIREGDYVIFDTVKGKKGITAVNVKLI